MADDDAAREERMMYGDSALTEEELNEKYPNRPHNHSRTLRFAEIFISLGNPLQANRTKAAGPRIARAKVGPHGRAAKSPNELRRDIITSFISKWRHEVGNDFYPAMRLLIPDKDRDRAMYGLKESNLGRLLVKVMKINKDSEDGYNLMHWKLPGVKVTSAMAGDFAGRCHEVISKRPMLTEPGTLTIAEVNEMLDRLSVASKEENQLPILEQFYERMNPEELLWLIRIILRQIKIGASEKTILEIWHPDAENLFNISSSLRRVCWELSDPKVRLASDDKGLQLGQCFAPQLAAFHMKSMEQVVKRMKLTDDDHVFWIEEKLDGERMQMHMVEDEQHPGGKRFKFWSRKAKDYTYLYGDGFKVTTSALTRHIEAAFHDGVRNIILDGEMITWDPSTDTAVPFGHLKTAAKHEQDNPYSTKTRPLFRIFDCLYLNDVDLTRYTLRNRREALSKSITNVHRRLEIHSYIEAQDVSAIDPELRRVVAESSEGLVLKNPRSAYKLNERNDDWIKVKPEYMDEFGEALDCVVIGGYYGSGKRGGVLSSFLCGLRVDEEAIEQGAHPQKCYSFFKVGGGFSGSDYADVRHRTEGKWRTYDAKDPPTEFIVLGGGERQHEKPDMWIMPEDSIVLEVKAASVTTSGQFGYNKTLRFPRFKRIREDKDWQTSLSMSEFDILRRNAQAEHDEKKFQVDDSRKQRRAAKRKRPLTVQGHEEEAASSEPKSAVFAGMSFLVLSDSQRPLKKSKLEIEQLVRNNGGTLVSSEKDPDTTVVSDRNVVKAASILKRGERNIIKPKWLYDSVQQAELLPYEPRHLFFTKEADVDAFSGNVDIFGDSYFQNCSLQDVRQLVQDMKVEDPADNAMQQLADEDLDMSAVPGTFFNGVAAYFDAQSSRLASCLAFASGVIVAGVDEACTHIVVESGSRHVRELRQASTSHQRMQRLVTPAWVLDSWNAQTRLDEERYTP